MGTNDPLPPPPPPGQVPPPPPAPPPVPQFPPSTTPTTVLPPTTAYPVQPDPLAGAGGGGLPPGPPPTAPPPTGGNPKLPWIIAGAVAVVAAVVIAVVALASGDDTTSGTVATTAAPTTIPVVTEAPTTAAPPTTPEPTLQITTPPVTEPPATEPPTSAPGVTVVADDTKTFTVLLLDSFQTDTKPLENDNGTFASVIGANDLDKFTSGTDHDTFGINVLVADSSTVQPPAELVQLFDPGADVCTERSTQSGYETLNGDAELLLLDGCGTGGNSGKVIMAIDVPAKNSVILLITQGPGPSNTDLLDFAQAVGESVVIL